MIGNICFRSVKAFVIQNDKLLVMKVAPFNKLTKKYNHVNEE